MVTVSELDNVDLGALSGAVDDLETRARSLTQTGEDLVDASRIPSWEGEGAQGA